jgi:exodeoxyribonuclease-3
VIVATWNVNGVRARWPRLLEWLADRKPDVACLQELKIVEGDFPHDELRAAGYHAACVCQPSWNGVAVIAREPPELVATELVGAGHAGARFVAARVGELEVASVYVPNGKTLAHPDYALKLAFLERLAQHVESRADRSAPLVVAGDVNVCSTDLDSFGGEKFRGTIFHTDEERALVGRLRDAGLVDLFRSRHPDVPGFSFWDYRAGCFHKNQGMRIDVLFASEPIARRVTDVFVDRDYRKKSKLSGAIPSDHAPVVATLTASPSAKAAT